MATKHTANDGQPRTWQAGFKSDASNLTDSPFISGKIYKIVVIGGPNLGKTSVIRALCGDKFSPSKIKTFGIDFRHKLFPYGNRKEKANIWDTCFSMAYLETLPNMLKGCDGVIIVFDKSKAESFDMVKKSIILVEHCTEDAVPIIMLGIKSDLGEYEGLADDITEIAINSKRVIHYSEVTSFSGVGILDAFTELMMSILQTAHIASDSRKSYRNTRNTLARISVYSQSLPNKRLKCCLNT